jgi:aspartate carbamoyltransferase regulatory subunit
MSETEPEPVFVQRIVTCHTPGCVLDGVEIQVPLYVNSDGILRCSCGECGQPITDMKEVA